MRRGWRYKDITGKRYGRLVVLGECKGLKWGNTRWECECDCGRKKVIRQSSLHGGTMSCGCLVREAVALHVKSRRTLPEAAYNLSRRNRECVYLSDTYIRSRLKHCGVKDATLEMIELKREQLALTRGIRELRGKIDGVT